MTLQTDYIRCHGSGNRFLLLDAAADPQLEALGEHPALVRAICRADVPTDGLLLTVRRLGGLFGMRMFNTDGSEAEMCGNGIRCVARAVAERYLRGAEAFDLLSGGRRYALRRTEPIYDTIPTYRVDLPVRLASDDFPPSLGRGAGGFAGGGEEIVGRAAGFVNGAAGLAGGAGGAFDGAAGFIGERIEALDPALRFTYLNPGNPHLAAAVEALDAARLARLGERVKELRELFPRGINVTLFVPAGRREIRTATYERGVGPTSSCGTAMTASTTAACLLGLCPEGEEILVKNAGGMVRCRCRRTDGGIVTSLAGNATFEADGALEIDFAAERVRRLGEAALRRDEIDRYRCFYRSLQG